MKIAAKILGPLLFLAASSLLAADAVPAQKLASIGDLVLDSGEVIRDCKVGYRTAGQLNAARSNAILVPSWFAGRSQGLLGWIGPGNLYDTEKYFVIAVDALGDGVSSSPSNSTLQPRQNFPLFSMRDTVRAQHELVTRELKLDHLYAVSGLSMGGMQAFVWAVMYPGFMDKVVPIVGTTKQTAQDIVLWQTQLDLLEASHGTPADVQKAMDAIAGINELELRTPSWIAANVKDAQATLVSHRKSMSSLDAFDYMSQLRAMLGVDVYRDFGGSLEQAAKAVKAKMLVVVSLQDHMVNPAPAREFARVAGADLVTLTSDCGHLATSCERDVLVREVTSFLAR